ncbi:sulfatase [Halalkalibaculum sp. DA384]|uniref:sulfatase family protein n=1 Tax=Halalkalibaculum sp. DA384 TaxID=3373606 RepID=UPI003754AAF6
MKYNIGFSILLPVFMLLGVSGNVEALQSQTKDNRSPNIIIIFADDLGYGDLSSYGHPTIKTPNLDRLAEEGMRFTDFHVTSGVCTPSRASLLTGSYPIRVGLASGYIPGREQDIGGKKILPWGVLIPLSEYGLHPDEFTIADYLKKEGYTTGHIGKWHLGHHPPFLPTRQGFDYYFGIPYSNDMGHNNYSFIKDGFISGPTPILRNEKVIEVDPDQSLLTRRYADEAIDFITKHREKPFFLYLAHSMPHVPIAASHHFKDRSEYGIYGDVIEELDWSVGHITKHLDKLGLDDNTIVMFTSDNGAAVWEGEGGWVWTSDLDGRPTAGDLNYRSGSNEPLRGSKATTWEGGFRVPFIVRWPGHIPAGSITEQLTTSMDILPTIAAITGGQLPNDRIIDGHNIWPLLSGEPGAVSPYEAFYYYRYDRLQAVRSGKWKLHLFRPEEGRTTMLYNLEEDIGETTDVSEKHPEVVKRLQRLADEARRDLGDSVTGQEGKNVRPIGEL